MKNILIVLLVLLLNLASLYAQQIKVTVNGSGNPIVGATVRLLELDRSSHTDARGQVVFANVPKGIYRIFVRVIGYASTTNTVQVDGPLAETTFTLHESAIGIEEVVVSASPYPRTADDQYQSAESKSMVELHDSPVHPLRRKFRIYPVSRSAATVRHRPVQYFADFRTIEC